MFPLATQHHNDLFTATTAMLCCEEQFASLEITEALYHAIKGFSISRLYHWLLSGHDWPNEPIDPSSLLSRLTYSFLPALFEFLNKSVCTANLQARSLTIEG